MKIKLTLLMLLLVSSTLFLTACNTENMSYQEQEIETEETVELTKLELPLSWYDGGFWPYLHVAIEEGYFKEQGLEVELVENAGSAITSQLIGMGEFPIGIVASEVAMIAKSKGVPLKVVSVIDKVSFAGITCHKDANVNSAEDLIGKKVGVTITSNTYQQYLAFIASEGIDQDSIEEVPIGGAGAEFFAGDLDCHALMPGITESLAELKGVEVDTINYYDEGLEMYGLTLVANEDFLEENPKLIQKIVTAITKGMEFEKENPEAAFEIMLNHNPDLTNVEYERLLFEARMSYDLKLDDDIDPADGIQSEDVWQYTMETLWELGLLEEEIILSEFYTNEFVI